MNMVKIGISTVILLIGMSISGAVVLDADVAGVAGGVITIQNGTETIEMHLNECSNESPRHWGYTHTVDANGTKTVREFNRSEMDEMMAEMDVNDTEAKVHTYRIDRSNTTNVIEVSHNTSDDGSDVVVYEDDGQLKIGRMPNFVERLWTTFRGLW